ncbi:DUF6351 family protein [Acinetobacter sp. YH12239]|uniref:DUF6351 family protein n=1 Tax=Acinetobacter sp. YH12239 TaxID=2601166 RepID=UPI0015D14705|nr:DUF6351 family protein [Acinetobacter sp. YH12239]
MKTQMIYTLLSVAISSSLLVGCKSSSESGGNSGGGNGSQPTPTNPTDPDNPTNKLEKEFVTVLSTRPDLVTDNDVLIELDPSINFNDANISIHLNGQDIKSRFSNAQNRVLLDGLQLGENLLKIETPNAIQNLYLKNFSTTGPLLSGPQINPWTCTNGSTDLFCRKPVQYNYYYRNLVGTLQTYNPEKPPSAGLISKIKTDTGVEVPFIIREEVGYQNRDEYRFAVLFNPNQPWTALNPQPQFNNKLLVTHGQSCGNDYQSATAPTVVATSTSILPDITIKALGKGYGVMSTALSNSGHNCNLAIQAESIIMAKERFIEQYGTLDYTIGQGCSGGALASQWVANAYPGVYQGLLVTCSFPDAWSTASQFADYHIMINYFKTAEGRSFLPHQINHIQGHISEINGYVSELAQFDVARPNTICSGISETQLYNATSNPNGTRCSIQEAAVNLLGLRNPTEVDPNTQQLRQIWSPVENQRNIGFANLPIDNVGVQYGLQTLFDGVINAEKFVLLNERLGGVDIDINPISERLYATEQGLKNAYRTGLINVANNLDQVAIIDCRGPDPAIFHDAYRAFAIRARLDKAHGHHNNQLLYGGDTIMIGDLKCLEISFDDMNQWLDRVKNDTSNLPLPQKLTRNKVNLNDSCITLGTIRRSGFCNNLRVPVYKTPRMVAGDQISTYANKCKLQPLTRRLYPNINFTDEQWTRLQKVFPDGVCDYTQDPVGFGKTYPWLTYQNQNGQINDVIYGGKQLDEDPNRPEELIMPQLPKGWISNSFRLS